MPDENRLPVTDDLGDDDDPETGDDDETGQQVEVTPEAFKELQDKFAALEASQTRTQRDVTAAIGRYQSLAAKVEKAPEDTASVRQLQAQSTAVREALEALIEDEAADPKVQSKARAALAKMPDPEKEELRDRVAALEAARGESRPQGGNGPSSFESEIVDEIESYGLDPDDSAFDWRGEGTSLLTTQGPAAARRYFRAKIKELLDTKNTTERRQARKNAGGEKKVTPAGGSSTSPLHSENREEAMKHLESLGIL